jgi:uncharacterized membrane protein
MNMNAKEFLLALVLLPILDAPWLWYQSSASRSMFTSIQGGSPVVMRLWPAIIVYIALAYLLLQQTSVLGAALNGSAVYAVYDFTNLVVFKNYSLSFAMQDTVWGGILFAAAYLALEKIRKYMNR